MPILSVPLPPECRAEFMQAVADALAGAEPGPGVLYRKIAELQRSTYRASGRDTRTRSAAHQAPPARDPARDAELKRVSRYPICYPGAPCG